uniref:Zeta_toxin domain-containing protein n=1 Tax=Caenorhabditis tropicalis TaxID=1561998 RepID=A0A1I7U122_9PELO
MTGLIYNRPADPLQFLEDSILKIRATPGITFSWDMFLEPHEGRGRDYPAGSPLLHPQPPQTKRRTSTHQQAATQPQITTNAIEDAVEPIDEEVEISREPSRSNTVEHRTPEPRLPSEDLKEEEMVVHRVASVTRAAEVAKIPDVPIILFMGGPGGGKTRHAARVADSLVDNGLVHICMPDIIRTALGKYKDKYPEWKDANEHYVRGELIPNQLALTLLKAEMGRHPDATGFFLEGYPREARQVEDFERQVKSVNMALILDYDERTLRDHMERRGLGMEIIDQKIKEFKQKTLPSAKYFDDQKLLHLVCFLKPRASSFYFLTQIPGEKDDQVIYEKMKGLVVKAMETGVPVLATLPPHAAERNHIQSPPEPAPVVASPIMAESEISNTEFNTSIVNHEEINHDMSTSAIREPRSVAQTPLHSSGSGAVGGENVPETPAVQTPHESRATSTARSRESARKSKTPTPGKLKCDELIERF